MVNTTEAIIAFTDMLIKHGHQSFNAHITLVCRMNLEVLLSGFKTKKRPELPVKLHLENSPQGFLFAVQCCKCKSKGPALLDLQDAYMAAHRGGWEHAPEFQVMCPACVHAVCTPSQQPLRFDPDAGEALVVIKLDGADGLQVGFSKSVLDYFKTYPSVAQNVQRRLQEKIQPFVGLPFDVRTQHQVQVVALDVLAGFGLKARRQ